MRNPQRWLVLLILLILAIGSTSAAISAKQQVNKLNVKVDTTDKDLLNLNEATIRQLQSQTASQKQQIEKLNKDLQSKAAQKAQNALVAALVPTVVAAPVVAPVPSNTAKMDVYMRESGNNAGAVNKSSGACGVGQALPCSKLPCSLSDYGCQDTWFTNYMLARYGTWENAWQHELDFGWW